MNVALNANKYLVNEQGKVLTNHQFESIAEAEKWLELNHIKATVLRYFGDNENKTEGDW